MPGFVLWFGEVHQVIFSQIFVFSSFMWILDNNWCLHSLNLGKVAKPQYATELQNEIVAWFEPISEQRCQISVTLSSILVISWISPCSRWKSLKTVQVPAFLDLPNNRVCASDLRWNFRMLLKNIWWSWVIWFSLPHLLTRCPCSLPIILLSIFHFWREIILQTV